MDIQKLVLRILNIVVCLLLLVGCTSPQQPASPTTIITQKVLSLSPTIPSSLTPKPSATPSPTPEISGIEVNFTTEDGKKLAGTLFEPGLADIAVVLAHQGTTGTDQKSWQPFAKEISGRGFSSLTFDFRGRGDSEGPFVVSEIVKDLDAAVNFLHQQGYERIVCIGASMGGSACLATALDNNYEGLGVIASPRKLSATVGIRVSEFPMLTMPKLFVCAEKDQVAGMPSGLARETVAMYDASPHPKQIAIIPGTEHGTFMFAGEFGDEFREVLLNFLDGLHQNE